MQHILIATDCAITSAGLTTLINQDPEFQISGQVTNGIDAGTVIERDSINLVLVDLAMRGENALLTLSRLHHQFPKVGLIALGSPADREPAEVIRKGALGYLLTDSPATEILRVLHVVAHDELCLDCHLLLRPSDKRAMPSDTASLPSPRYDKLSAREREVLPLVILGYSNKQIAQRLFISVKTVESHKGNIMRKLAVDCHCELVRYAMRHHLMTF